MDWWTFWLKDISMLVGPIFRGTLGHPPKSWISSSPKKHISVIFSAALNNLPSGKHTKNYGKSPFSMGKSIISMAIFNSYFDITRGYCTVLYPCSFRPHRHSLRSNLLPLSPGAWTGYLVWLGKSSPETMVFTMKKMGGFCKFSLFTNPMIIWA